MCLNTRKSLSFAKRLRPPRFSAAGMVRMKNHEKSGGSTWFEIQAKSSLLGGGETPGRARTFISTSRGGFPGTENDAESSIAAYKLQLTPPQGLKLRPQGLKLFFQTFQPNFVISWPISMNEPSLESLKSQQNDGAIFVPVSPRERTIAPFLRRVLTLSAQFPRIRTCSGQINLYRGEIAVVRNRNERERERGGGEWTGSRETSSKTNWLEGPHWIKDTSVLTYLRLGYWRPRERTHCPGH